MVIRLLKKPYSQSVLVIFLANAKESLTVYSLIVNGDNINTRNAANLYDDVLITSGIGLKMENYKLKVCVTGHIKSQDDIQQATFSYITYVI